MQSTLWGRRGWLLVALFPGQQMISLDFFLVPSLFSPLGLINGAGHQTSWRGLALPRLPNILVLKD